MREKQLSVCFKNNPELLDWVNQKSKENYMSKNNFILVILENAMKAENETTRPIGSNKTKPAVVNSPLPN